MECLGCEGERVLRGKWYLRVQVMKGCGYEVWEVRCWYSLLTPLYYLDTLLSLDTCLGVFFDGSQYFLFWVSIYILLNCTLKFLIFFKNLKFSIGSTFAWLKVDF